MLAEKSFEKGLEHSTAAWSTAIRAPIKELIFCTQALLWQVAKYQNELLNKIDQETQKHGTD